MYLFERQSYNKYSFIVQNNRKIFLALYLNNSVFLARLINRFTTVLDEIHYFIFYKLKTSCSDKILLFKI